MTYKEYKSEALSLLNGAVKDGKLSEHDAVDIYADFIEECEETSPETALEKLSNNLEDQL